MKLPFSRTRLSLPALLALVAGAVWSPLPFSAARPSLAADAPPVSPAPPFTGQIGLVLWHGLPRGTPGSEAANLVLNLAAENGRWKKVWGSSLSYNNGVHIGVVEAPQLTADAFRLRINVEIGSDQWVDGGSALYDLELRRLPSGKFEGSFKGTFLGRDAAGKVTGEIKPPQKPFAGFRPVEPGEHPRLLFRKHELPALKEKLKTPLGKAYLARIENAGDVVSLGMMYQFTGDAKYALAAIPQVEQHMKNGTYISIGSGSGGWGHQLMDDVAAYDLCFDAWPAELKNRLDEHLVDVLPKLVRYVAVTSHANTHPCSNYYGPGHGAPGFASMVYLNDKGTEPDRLQVPRGTGVVVGPPRLIPPLADYKPGEGVPAGAFESGKVLGPWLFAGPLPIRGRGETIGRNTPAKVQVGTQVKYGVLKDGKPQVSAYPFAKIDAEGGTIDLPKALGSAGPSTGLFFTTVNTSQDEVIRPACGRPDPVMFISGQLVRDGETLKLKRGQHTVLVILAADEAKGTLAPKLVAAGGDDDADSRRHATLWGFDHAAWQKTGLDGIKQNIIDVGILKNYLHYRLGIGDGGFMAETGGYAAIASWAPLQTAVAYYKTHGVPPSPYDDVTHLMVRRMMQVQFRDDGKIAYQKLNSVAGFDAKWVAAAFPIIPDKYKPTVLWGWNKAMGVTGEENAGNVLGGPRGGYGGIEAAYAFLHYPLDMKPVHPKEAMPLEWETKTFGFQVFRSGWNASDDFIGQAFARSHLIGGWNHPNAGTFRLYGLNREWVVGSTERVGFRLQEPCVQLPDDEVNEGACGIITHRETAGDGSATLTIDYKDVYSSKKGRLYDANLLRIEENHVPSGITGLRALAFDYSGKSGAPCLLVVADKITGGGKREWLWPLPAGALEKTKVEGNGFVIDYGDASLRATFVTPENLKVEALTEDVAVGKIGNSHRSFVGRLSRVKTESAGGDFLLVATVQKKDAPPVTVEGKGIDATVRVGGQTVRFDGAKIVLGK